MSSKERIRAGKLLIRRVFIESWDPIGIGKDVEAQDEYDAYLGTMYALLARDAPAEEIVAYLNWIETDRMGLNSDVRRLAAVAEELRSLHLSG
jgi:hypothetical protein